MKGTGAWLPSEAVAAACQSKIARIESERERLREEHIRIVMERPRWFREFPDRKEAIEICDAEDPFSDNLYRRQQGRVEDLLTLAKAAFMSNEKIFVSPDTFSDISKFYEVSIHV